ncbi:MAG: zinc metalloprotease HtpX [Armatimonadota bacterium]
MGNYLKTAILFTVLGALFLFVGYLIGGQGGVLIALALSLGLTGFSYWQSERLALSMARARPLDRSAAPWLHAANEELSARAGIPTPPLYVSADPQPNAFACGRGPGASSVCVTRGLLETMSEREVIGVLAHELAHIKNRDVLTMSIVAAVSQAIMFLQYLAFFVPIGRDEDGPNPLAVLLAVIVAPFAAILIQMAVSRTREYAADATGAQLMGDPLPLADALTTLGAATKALQSRVAQPATAHMYIAQPLSGGLAGLFSTHPPIEERVRRLRALAV